MYDLIYRRIKGFSNKLFIIAFLVNISNLLFILFNSFGKFIIYEDSYALFNRDNKQFINFLFEPHNGHIILIPKLLNSFFINLKLSPTGYNITISIFILFFGLIILWKILNTINQENSYKNNIFFLCSFFWISPWQWENLIWEFQIPWFLISLMILILTLINFEEYFNKKKNELLIHKIFLTLSPLLVVLSSGQGICYLNCLLITLIFKRKKSILPLLTTFFSYYIFFSLRSIYDSDTVISYNFLEIILYCLVIASTIFKAPLSGFYQTSYKEWIIPIFSSILFQVNLLLLIFRVYIQNQFFKIREINLFIPILFGLQFIFLTSITRSHYGIHQGAVSRYLTCINLIPIGLLIIIYYLICKDNNFIRSNFDNKTKSNLLIVLCLCILLNGSSIFQTIYQTQIAFNTRLENFRLFQKTCLLNKNSNNYFESIRSNFSKMKTYHGVNFPPLPDANKFERFQSYLNSNFCEINF